MNIYHRRLRLLAALLTICLLPTSASAEIPKFDSLYVFGDSLADNGNVFIMSKVLNIEPAIPPSEHPFQTYFDGRFSNGYIGFEFLWERLSRHAPGSVRGLKPFLSSPFLSKTAAVNFAYGGTGTAELDQTPGGFWAPGLQGQIELFRVALRGKKPPKRALYAIATGANDYRVDPYNVPMDPREVVGNIVESIITLYRLGARDVMVFDLPDLGLIPANRSDPGPPSDLSALHNMLLEEALNDLQARLPALHLIQVKLDPLFQVLIRELESQEPALDRWGPPVPPEVPPASLCLFVYPALCQDVSPDLFNRDLGYLFWDVVHPTTEAHHRLGDYLYQQLADSY